MALNRRHSEDDVPLPGVAAGEGEPRAVVLTGDVARAEDAARLVGETVETFGRIDVLVHAAGPFIRDHLRLADTSADEWNRMVDGNLGSAYHLVRAAIPDMRRRRWGRVVLFGFAEAGGAPGWPERAAFAAAKSGLVSLARSLAFEEAPNGVTVNVICPGDIRPPWKEASIAAARGRDDGRTPLGRPGTGEDVARVVAFLCEEDSDFITGSVIEVTGGLSPLRPKRGGARGTA